MSDQPGSGTVPGGFPPVPGPAWAPTPVPVQETKRPERLAAMLQFPRRILFLLIALFLATMVIFVLIRSVGDPVRMMGGPRLTPAEAERLTRQLGLDQPLIVQYFRWLGRALHGDLGTSLVDRRPVSQAIGERLPNTLLLLAAALGLALLLALIAALLAVLVHKLEQKAGPLGSVLKGLGRLLAFVPAAMPVFCLALFLILLFSVQFHLLPTAGMFDPTLGPGDLGDRFRHLVLPAVALALYPALLTAQALAREVTLPRAAGGWRLWLGGLLKLLGTLFGQIGGLVSALVVVETVLAWPGIGRMAVDAAERSDFPLLSGLLLTFSLLVLAGRLLAELFRWLERLLQVPPPSPPPQVTPWRRIARRVYVLAALALLLVPVGLAIAGTGESPSFANHTDTAARLQPPSTDHPWGTDVVGRDLQARVLRGALSSLLLAAAVGGVLLLPAGLCGALTGFLASRRTFWLESLADLLLLPADALLFIPAVPGAIVAAKIFLPKVDSPELIWLLLGLLAALVLLPRTIRVYQTLWTAVPERRKGLLLGLAGPGVLLPAAFFAAFGLMAAVDFLGAGVQPPLISLGNVMNGARQYVQKAPWLVLVPGIVLAACAFAFYTAADALIGFFHTKGAMARLNE